MKKKKRLDRASLDEHIDELTVEAGSDDERIWNFQQALQKHIWLPCWLRLGAQRVELVS